MWLALDDGRAPGPPPRSRLLRHGEAGVRRAAPRRLVLVVCASRSERRGSLVGRADLHATGREAIRARVCERLSR